MAIEFDGATESIDCGSGASLADIFDSGGSYAAWVYADSYGEDLYGQIINAGGIRAFTIRNTGGDYVETVRFVHLFSGDAGYWVSGDNTFTLSLWTHLAVTYDAGATTNDPIFYIDGAVVGPVEVQTPTGTRDSDDAGNYTVGNNTSAGVATWDGKLEDVRAINRIITPEEVAALAAGYRGPLGGEVLWFSMNEAVSAAGAWEATSLANGTNLLPDLSGNENTGDPVNTPIGRASKAPRYGVAV